MNTFTKLSLLFIATIPFWSCGNKEKQEDIIVERVIPKPSTTVKTVTRNDENKTVKWVSGNSYTYYISYNALDSIAPVENYGEMYHDNAINLRIARGDGSDAFNKTITKNTFASYLTSDMKEHGVLLSMVYDKSDNTTIHFVVSIGSPDETNDDFVSLEYAIDNNGNVSIKTLRSDIM